MRIEFSVHLANRLLRSSRKGCEDVVDGSRESPVLRFGPFEMALTTGELYRVGVRVKLAPQPFKLLALLASCSGEVVTREEIRQRIWGQGTFVDFDKGVNFCIRRIRATLDDEAKQPRYIETLSRRGYRFVAAVDRSNRLGSAFPKLPIHSEDHDATTGQGITLAVLPFATLDAHQQDGFADGLTEMLITNLAKRRGLRVTPRQSVIGYKGVPKPLNEIGRELNVNVVVAGTLLRSKQRVRITVQLSDAAKDRTQWAESYERDLTDILSLQSEVTQAIAKDIEVKLTLPEHMRFNNSDVIEPSAYEAYVKGRYHWNKRTEDALKRGIEYFDDAISRDPKWALAYTGLADSYLILGCWGSLWPSEAYPKAKAAAVRALELDCGLAEAHASLAYAKMIADMEWISAEKGLCRAIELNPNSATVHQWYADYLTAVGRHDDAIAEIRVARDLDPLSLSINTDVGWSFYYAQRYDDAIEQFTHSLEMDSTFVPARCGLGASYERKSMFSESLEEFEAAVSFSRESPMMLAGLAHVCAISGKKRSAQRILKELIRLSKHRYIPSYDTALIYLALGDVRAATKWMGKAVLERSPNLMYFKADPRLQSYKKVRALDGLLKSQQNSAAGQC